MWETCPPPGGGRSPETTRRSPRLSVEPAAQPPSGPPVLCVWLPAVPTRSPQCFPSAPPCLCLHRLCTVRPFHLVVRDVSHLRMAPAGGAQAAGPHARAPSPPDNRPTSSRETQGWPERTQRTRRALGAVLVNAERPFLRTQTEAQRRGLASALPRPVPSCHPAVPWLAGPPNTQRWPWRASCAVPGASHVFTRLRPPLTHPPGRGGPAPVQGARGEGIPPRCFGKSKTPSEGSFPRGRLLFKAGVSESHVNAARNAGRGHSRAWQGWFCSHPRLDEEWGRVRVRPCTKTCVYNKGRHGRPPGGTKARSPPARGQAPATLGDGDPPTPTQPRGCRPQTRRDSTAGRTSPAPPASASLGAPGRRAPSVKQSEGGALPTPLSLST